MYSHVAKVLVMVVTGPPHQTAKWQLHNSHAIKRAVIDQLGLLGGVKNDGMQVKIFL